MEFIPEAFRNFCVRGFVQKRIVSDRGLLIIHSERLSPAGPERVCLSVCLHAGMHRLFETLQIEMAARSLKAC